MSRGDLQEMEVVKDKLWIRTKPGELSNHHISLTPGQGGSYEDLGGPTPENY